MDSHELRFIYNAATAAQGLASDLAQGAGEELISSALPGERSSFHFKGDVDHVQLLSAQLSALLKTADFADVTFVVESERFMCHRIILSSRCEYFRALLFGGMKEATSRDEIVLKDTPVNAFKVLLLYLYSGTVSLRSLKEDDVIDLLGLAHKYGLLALQSALGSYLEGIVNARNVTLIFDVACLYQLTRVRDKCLAFMDHNALEVLDSEGFTGLSEAALLSIIKRDSFCAGEFRIFTAVCKWIEANTDEDKDVSPILGCILLPLISLHDLFHGVRFSGLYSSDVILDAIQMKTECKVNDMPFRGHLEQDVNLAQECHGAEVLSGEFRDTLFNGEYTRYDLEQGFTRHLIGADEKEGIVISLGRPSIINTIRMLLWDKDPRSYSYVLECSLDNINWSQIVDYSSYFCRSWQRIHFPPKVVRYVRVLGTMNTVNRYFHLVNFQCSYVPNVPRVVNGIIEPVTNVAYVLASALLIEGVSRNRNALIDGNTENYDWESGYTCHQIGSGCITIQLAQPYIIGSMRMLLWDCDDREYSYYIEVSTNQRTYEMVVDKRNESCRSWQTMVFEPRPVSFIKIVGTRNTANEVFHVVHIECPSTVPVDTISSDAHGSNDASIESRFENVEPSSEPVVDDPELPPIVRRTDCSNADGHFYDDVNSRKD